MQTPKKRGMQLYFSMLDQISKTPSQCSTASNALGVHIVIFSVVIVLGWWRWLLLLQQLFAIEWARGVEFEPRTDAVQVEPMVLVAR
jgi:hypothetical protein